MLLKNERQIKTYQKYVEGICDKKKTDGGNKFTN